MFPGDPCRAFLMDGNSLAENTLVTAHVLGHADFSKNNQLFSRFHEMAGGNIVEQAAAHAHRIDAGDREPSAWSGSRRCSTPRSRSSRTSTSTGELHRRSLPASWSPTSPGRASQTRSRTASVTCPAKPSRRCRRSARCARRVPPHPEYDLLWFIANYAPELEHWERDIFLAVRDESLYFYPVFACQIMNEGWASYWHARLLREADFLPQQTLPRGDQGAFRRGAAVRRGRADRARRSIPTTSASRCGSTSSRSAAWTTRAR